MKDFIGNELKINDYIAYARNPYANLYIGKVVGFTPKGIKIVAQHRDGTWAEYKYQNNKYEIVYPYQCVKVEYSEGE